MSSNDQAQDGTAIESAIDELTKASARLSEAQTRVSSAQGEVRQVSDAVLGQLRRLRRESNHEIGADLLNVVRHLYWHQTSIQSRDIAEAAGFGVGSKGIHGMLAAIGPIMSGILCTGCGAELVCTSRSWVPGSPPRCPTCVSEENEERNRRSRLLSKRARAIGSALVTERVRDWRAITTLILAYPPAANGVIRGSQDDHQLGVWSNWEKAQTLHNALLQLGAGDDESFGVPAAVARDLVATGFQSAGWDSERTRQLLDPITAEAAHAILTRAKRDLDTAVEAAVAQARERYRDGSEAEPAAVWPWDNDSLYLWHQMIND